jgi:hypothetical protein
MKQSWNQASRRGHYTGSSRPQTQQSDNQRTCQPAYFLNALLGKRGYIQRHQHASDSQFDQIEERRQRLRQKVDAVVMDRYSANDVRKQQHPGAELDKVAGVIPRY